MKWLTRGGKKTIIGMLHLLPLPGTPIGGVELSDVLDQAHRDAYALEEGGVDAILVQNRGDRVFPAETAPPDVVAAMGAVTSEIVRAVSVPVGVHVLRNDTASSLAVARVTGAEFVRAAVLTGISESAQGTLKGNPYEILRYRRAIGAENVAILADVSSMHNKTSREEAPEAASEAVFFGDADAVVVANPSEDETKELLSKLGERVEVPVLLGGHTDRENAPSLLEHADGAIVGGAFERDSRKAGVEVALVKDFISRIRSLDSM